MKKNGNPTQWADRDPAVSVVEEDIRLRLSKAFVYDSKQLTKIDQFASDNNLHVMIINTQAFAARGEDARRIYMRLDAFRSRKPIDVISATNPILIIDEPQSVLGADKKNATREKLQEFKPLFTLLYSATHRADDIVNMVYRLDAMDAYNQKLVKKISVKGIEQKGSTATNGYLYLESIELSEGNPRARIGFDKKVGNGVKQVTQLADDGFDIYQKSGNLEEYAKIKLKEKKLDFIVANDVGGGKVFGEDKNKASIIFADGRKMETERIPKTELADIILDYIK